MNYKIESIKNDQANHIVITVINMMEQKTLIKKIPT